MLFKIGTKQTCMYDSQIYIFCSDDHRTFFSIFVYSGHCRMGKNAEYLKTEKSENIKQANIHIYSSLISKGQFTIF